MFCFSADRVHEWEKLLVTSKPYEWNPKIIHQSTDIFCPKVFGFILYQAQCVLLVFVWSGNRAILALFIKKLLYSKYGNIVFYISS